MRLLTPSASLSMLVLLLAFGHRLSAADPSVFNVREYGAAGDGRTLDTAAINKAIEACTAAGGGRVELTQGQYLCGTIHLKSNVELHLHRDATLIGTSDLEHYQNFSPPEVMPESKWGRWHRALVLAVNAKNIRITGQGTIDGNKVFDAHGEEHMRGPHTILLGNCEDVTIRDLRIKDSANYAILFELTDRVDIRNVKITGGWDGVHFRGCKDRSCRDVTIADCQFFTGDDCIAGRYWDGVRVSNCVLNSSCNCVRLIGPATKLTIEKCHMYGPGDHPHRTSNRRNCLAGLNLQPGAWDSTQGRLDEVTINDITMENVSTPFHFVLRKGNTAGRISVNRVKATGVYFTASSVESWAESPFEEVSFRDVAIQCTGGGKREQTNRPVRAPGSDARPLPVWGFYLHRIKNLTLEQVRLDCVKDDLRPVLMAEGVERLILDGFTFPRAPDAEEPLVLKDVKHVEQRDHKP